MADEITFPREEYEAVVRTEVRDRYFAWLGIEETICGIPVEPLTLRKIGWLNLVESPFIIGGVWSYEHVAQFIWICSKQFCTDKDKRDEFMQSILEIDIVNAYEEITDYIERAYLDSIGGSTQSKVVTCSCATLATEMMDEPFHIPYDKTMDMPIAIIFQLMRVKALRNGHGSLVNKRSDLIGDKYLQELNEKMREERLKSEKQADKVKPKKPKRSKKNG